MLTPDVKDRTALEVYRVWGQFLARVVAGDQLDEIKALCDEVLNRDPVLRSATTAFLVDAVRDEAP
jgi:hypothetical protein